MPLLRSCFLSIVISAICLLHQHAAKAQGNIYEIKSVLYNSFGGALTGGLGAVINKGKDEKWSRAFLKGFTGGAVGGALMFCGKKSTSLIVEYKNCSYAWLSRAIFCAGNSMVENASANKALLSRFHMDFGFVRLDLYTHDRKLRPSIMPLAFGSTVFNCFHGRFDALETLRSGTFVFRAHNSLRYAPYLMASTTGNGFIINDTIRSEVLYHELFAHELLHTFQFMEFSGLNNYFIPLKDKWSQNNARFVKMDRWIHGDVNYLVMMGNYFLVNGGYKRSLYCRNFLENEAEVLSTNRISCPVESDLRH